MQYTHKTSFLQTLIINLFSLIWYLFTLFDFEGFLKIIWISNKLKQKYYLIYFLKYIKFWSRFSYETIIWPIKYSISNYSEISLSKLSISSLSTDNFLSSGFLGDLMFIELGECHLNFLIWRTEIFIQFRILAMRKAFLI